MVSGGKHRPGRISGLFCGLLEIALFVCPSVLVKHRTEVAMTVRVMRMVMKTMGEEEDEEDEEDEEEDEESDEEDDGG